MLCSLCSSVAGITLPAPQIAPGEECHLSRAGLPLLCPLMVFTFSTWETWTPPNLPCHTAAPGAQSGVSTQFWTPDLRAWAWAWEREETSKEASYLREISWFKKIIKIWVVGIGGSYNLLFWLKFQDHNVLNLLRGHST